MCHSNCVKSCDAHDVAFVPVGAEAAFEVFHYSGMMGLSEAHAESIGSILKRFNKTLGTRAVVDATMLRAAGLSGGVGEEPFLQLCWARFFGSGLSQKFNFQNTSKQGKRNAKRRRLGAGSGPVARVLKTSLKRRRRSTDALRKVASEVGDGPRGRDQWLQSMKGSGS